MKWLDLLIQPVLGRLERRNQEYLERLKSELNTNAQENIETLKSQYAALHTSVHYLSAAQNELRVKTLTAVEALWENFLFVQNAHAAITYLEGILTVKELRGLFKTADTNKLKSGILHYKDEKQFSELMLKCTPPERNKARLFISDRLWLIYFSVTAFYLRLAFLTHYSLEKNTYQNWREDRLTTQHLQNALPKEIVQEILNRPEEEYSPTMYHLSAHLEAAFLREARKVLSGSQAFADSLSDINSVLQVEVSVIEMKKKEGERV